MARRFSTWSIRHVQRAASCIVPLIHSSFALFLYQRQCSFISPGRNTGRRYAFPFLRLSVFHSTCSPSLLFVPRGSEFLFHQLSCLTGGSAFLPRFEPVDFFENDARSSKHLRWRVIDRSADSIFSETSGSSILSFYDDSLFLKTRVADNVGKVNS